MRIDWMQTAAGMTIADIKQMLLRAASQNGTMTLISLADAHPAADRMNTGPRGYLRQSRAIIESANLLLKTLAASGMIEASDSTANADDEPLAYRLTPVALSLVNSSRLKRIPKSKALEAVEELRTAATGINADPTMMYDVTELAIYGSVLTDAVDLGDVDVAYGMKIREHGDFEAFHAAHPQPLGFPDLGNVYRWPQTVADRRLRVRRCVSLADIRHVKRLGCPMRMLLPDERDIPASPQWSPHRKEVILREDDGEALSDLEQAIRKRDAERRRELDAFQNACLAGNPPADADPKHVELVLLAASI